MTCLAYELPRFGLKGRAAENWLTAQGVALPRQPNSWLAWGDQNRILRLGRGEFLIEGPAAENLQSAWQPGQADLYRVPRHDAAFVLAGESVPALLQEICTLDTRPQTIGNKILMTLAAGISVSLTCEPGDAGPVYRLWCDATYGDYMTRTLQEILVQPA